MVIVRSQNIVDIPDTFAYVNVTRSTTGDGTAVLAAPAAGQRYLINVIQLENIGVGAVTVTILSDETELWHKYLSGNGAGMFIEIPLLCGVAEPIYVNLDADVDVDVQMLVSKV